MPEHPQAPAFVSCSLNARKYAPPRKWKMQIGRPIRPGRAEEGECRAGRNYRTGFGRICRAPTNSMLPGHDNECNQQNDRCAGRSHQASKADRTGRMWPDPTLPRLGPQARARPQKCVVWTVVDSRTTAKHRTARQVNHFVDRYRMFTVLDATFGLGCTQATIQRLPGLENLVDSSIERGAATLPIKPACCSAGNFRAASGSFCFRASTLG